MQSRAHRTDSHVQDRSDLGIRQFVQVAQNQHFPVPTRECVDETADSRDVLRGGHGCCGIGVRGDIRPIGWEDVEPNDPPLPPTVLSRQIASDSIEIGRQRGAAGIVPIKIAHEDQKHLLRHILRNRRGAAHCARESIDERVIAVVERGERIALAGSRPTEQFLIRRLNGNRGHSTWLTRAFQKFRFLVSSPVQRLRKFRVTFLEPFEASTSITISACRACEITV